MFRNLDTAAAGIQLVHRFPQDASSSMLSDQSSGMGVCCGDVDGDGLPELYFTNYDQGNRLYKNLGGFRFADITERAGVGGEGRWSAGCVFVDIDNDGDLDLHVCAYDAPNLLYVNDGNGKFTERASEFGLDLQAASVQMSFADYDLDGDLDAYLVTHRLIKADGSHVLPNDSTDALRRGVVQMNRKTKALRVAPRFQNEFSLMSKGQPGRIALVIAGQTDLLLKNDGGTFRSANAEANIGGHGIGLSATWFDCNDDGYPDVYVSNDYKGADQLYRNNRDGTFSDVIEDLCPHIPWFSMGADTGDINNDGLIDLFASDMSGTSHYKQKIAMGDMTDDAWFLDHARPPQYMRNAVFLNTGGGRMLEVAKLSGVASTDWTWSPKLADLDNDGWIDLFVANGMSRDYMNSDLQSGGVRGGKDWTSQAILKEKNLAFRNGGDLRFENVSEAWGVDALSASYGASLGDLDGDGDLDLVATAFDAAPLLYENRSTGNRLLIQLVGATNNRWGLGTKLQLTTTQGTQTRVLNSVQGFMSANEPLVHFGLGADQSGRLVVQWPGGNSQVIAHVAANQRLTLYEKDAVVLTAQPRPGPAFTEDPRFSNFPHQEREYDDFAKQPLLPGKRSQMGPGIACGDVDGDGQDDYYLGQAAGQPGVLVLGSGEVTTFPAEDAECEDQGAVLFDADRDGDLDLYVVSGGVESELGSATLEDRLYWNDGAGAFTKSKDTLPKTRVAGSCVCAGDFDRDGDLDLFVGGQAIPGRYPESSASQLLINNGGVFAEATDEIASGVETLKLVRAAIWSDVNDDGLLDLLVTQEWGPIAVFLQQQGRLIRSRQTGVEDRTGWWSGIAGGDLDGDGDMDYVVTNHGLNSKYHADQQHPAQLYRGDFDGTGNMRLVEAKYEDGVLLPERGKSCSTAAIPGLADRFSSYQEFAIAGLTDIYTSAKLGAADVLTVNTLESVAMINDGRGFFTVQPLPTLAQIAPGAGVLLAHFDQDQHLDLVIAQNDFSPQRETGRLDGGVSLLLRGVGDGTFVAVWPQESGILVAGDAQSCALTDIDHDGQPDVLFGVNNEPWKLFRPTSLPSGIAVELQGQPGNTQGVGAKITVQSRTGDLCRAEVYAGHGYLTQSSSKAFFPWPAARIRNVVVRWPDGSTQTVVPKPNVKHIRIQR